MLRNFLSLGNILKGQIRSKKVVSDYAVFVFYI